MNSTQALRKIRQKIFDYPPHKEEQASRALLYLKERVARKERLQARKVGPYSGLTRAELLATRTCEPDWY